MTGIEVEGVDGKPAQEPVVTEPITLSPEQVNGLLSRYQSTVLEFDRIIHWENSTVNLQPQGSRMKMHDELVQSTSSTVRTFETVFRVMGISDRARAIRDGVSKAESERRKQEVEALYGATPAYVSIG